MHGSHATHKSKTKPQSHPTQPNQASNIQIKQVYRRKHVCIRRTIVVITITIDAPSPAECTYVSLRPW